MIRGGQRIRFAWVPCWIIAAFLIYGGYKELALDLALFRVGFFTVGALLLPAKWFRTGTWFCVVLYLVAAILCYFGVSDRSWEIMLVALVLLFVAWLTTPRSWSHIFPRAERV